MKVKVQQGREEINSIGGISLIGGLFNSLKSLKKVDSMRMNKVKTGKIKHSGILKTVAGREDLTPIFATMTRNVLLNNNLT